MTIHRKETVEIIGELVALLNATFTINSASVVSSGIFLLTTTNTYHLRPLMKVTIASIEYTITAFVKDTSITISGDSIPVVSSFAIPAPFYYYGTVIDTTATLSGVKRMREITPMVYCYEPIKDRFFNRDSPIDRESDVTLFFLEQGNFESWKTDDFLNQAIKQMRSLAYRFIDEVCKESSMVGIIEDFTLINRAKMKLRDTDSSGKNLFNHTLSGVELTLNIPILRGQC